MLNWQKIITHVIYRLLSHMCDTRPKRIHQWYFEKTIQYAFRTNIENIQACGTSFCDTIDWIRRGLKIVYNCLNVWQVSTQLSHGDTCQLWMLINDLKIHLQNQSNSGVQWTSYNADKYEWGRCATLRSIYSFSLSYSYQFSAWLLIKSEGNQFSFNVIK